MTVCGFMLEESELGLGPGPVASGNGVSFSNTRYAPTQRIITCQILRKEDFQIDNHAMRLLRL